MLKNFYFGKLFDVDKILSVCYCFIYDFFLETERHVVGRFSFILEKIYSCETVEIVDVGLPELNVAPWNYFIPVCQI